MKYSILALDLREHAFPQEPQVLDLSNLQHGARPPAVVRRKDIQQFPASWLCRRRDAGCERTF